MALLRIYLHRGAAKVVDSMATSSRTTTNFILGRVFRAESVVPAGGVSLKLRLRPQALPESRGSHIILHHTTLWVGGKPYSFTVLMQSYWHNYVCQLYSIFCLVLIYIPTCCVYIALHSLLLQLSLLGTETWLHCWTSVLLHTAIPTPSIFGFWICHPQSSLYISGDRSCDLIGVGETRRCSSVAHALCPQNHPSRERQAQSLSLFCRDSPLSVVQVTLRRVTGTNVRLPGWKGCRHSLQKNRV